MKLQNMTDFVLNIDEIVIQGEDQEYNEWSLSCLGKIENYAKFLKKPLTLGMFVPCDENVNILFQPIHFNEWLSEYKNGIIHEYEHHTMLKYLKAKERVLFEDIKLGNYGNKMFHLTGFNNSYVIINGVIYNDNQNSAPQKTEDAIEDLLNTNSHIELTPSAIKQIGL